MLLSMEVGLSPRDFVLDGDPAPLLKKGRSLQFLADVYGGQTAAWIKMPLGTEVGLVLRDIVLNEGASPLPKKGAEPSSPIFGPFLLSPKGSMQRGCHLVWR